MLNKWMAVCVMIIVVSAGLARASDIDASAQTIDNVGNTDIYYLPSGSTAMDNSGISYTAPATVTIGQKGIGFSTTVASIQGNGNSTINILTAANNTGVELHTYVLDLDVTGTLNINVGTGTTTSANILRADNIVSGAGNTTVTVNRYSQFVVSGVNSNILGSSTGKFDLALASGSASFASGFRLANGTIGGIGELAVNGTLTLAADAAGKAFLSANGGTLDVVTALGGSNYANVIVGSTTPGYGTLSITNDGILNVGALTLREGASMAAGAGTLNATSLTVDGDFQDVAGVDTIVSGTTVVESGATYTVAGKKNEYKGGMLLEGELSNTNNGDEIWIGDKTSTTLTALTVDGGKITAVAGREFIIHNADIQIIEENAGYTLDAKGKLNLGDSSVTVNLTGNGTATFDTVGGIVMNNYHQVKGTVQLETTGVPGSMIVNEKAYIGNATATANVDLVIDNVNVAFKKGVQLDSRGALVASGADATITLGDGVGNEGDLVLLGNNALLGVDAPLNITGYGKIDVSGEGNSAHGYINAPTLDAIVRSGGELNVASNEADGLVVDSMTVYGTLALGTNRYNRAAALATAPGVLSVAGDLAIKNGGMVDANFATATITSTDVGNNRIYVEKGGQLSATTASINATGFGSVEISGSFTAGWDKTAGANGSATRLISDSNVNINSTGTISLTAELARNAVANTDYTKASWLIETTGSATITSKANTTYKSMYGILELDINAGKTVMYVKTARNQIDPNASEEEQRQQALENLRDMWGEKQIRECFGNLVFDVLEGNVLADPADSIAGQKNIDLLTAIGNPDSLNVSSNTLEYLNGAHLVGVTDVAIDTSRTFMSDITNRAKALNCQFVAAREITSSDALASTAMNSMAYNRIWVGGTGFWQDQDGRQGFSGYSYSATGLTLGFDKIITPNLAMGISGAYLKGDYEDDGALKHDSTIESFSAGLYATLSGHSGWYGTLFGAYTYSDNSLKELRNDPTTTDRSNSWGTSDFRTDTWSVGANAGYDLRLGDCFTLTPSVGINYIQARNSDHQSFLGGVATQRIKDARNRGIFVPVELTAQYDRTLANGGTLRTEFIGGYAYNLRSSGLEGSISYYDLTGNPSCGIASPDNVRHSYRGGVGFRYMYENYDIGARYDYMGKSGYTAHRLSANVGFSF